jgi:anti-sigma B factor antagonist
MRSGSVELRRQSGAWLLVLHGEHDLPTAPALRLELERAFAAGSAVIVDLSKVEFMDSTTLANIWHGQAEARQHSEHGFAVVAPPGTIGRRLLELVALDEVVPVYATSDEAIAAAQAQQENSISD